MAKLSRKQRKQRGDKMRAYYEAEIAKLVASEVNVGKNLKAALTYAKDITESKIRSNAHDAHLIKSAFYSYIRKVRSFVKGFAGKSIKAYTINQLPFNRQH